jgi:hypothetical protein
LARSGAVPELDLPRIRGRSLRLAATGWVISLVLAPLIALTLTLIGFGPNPVAGPGLAAAGMKYRSVTS